jgi:hypothetical protein
MTLTVTLKDGRTVVDSGPSTPAMTGRLQEAVARGRDWEEFGLGPLGTPTYFTAGDVAKIEVTR